MHPQLPSLRHDTGRQAHHCLGGYRVVRAGNERGDAGTGIGPQPVLARDLPAWLRDELLAGADRPRKPGGKRTTGKR